MSAYPPPARLIICRRDSSQESRSALATPRRGISLEKESLLTGTSPLALCAIVALLGCDCVPMQLKAMTFHGVRGVEKREDLQEKNNVTDAWNEVQMWSPFTLSVSLNSWPFRMLEKDWVTEWKLMLFRWWFKACSDCQPKIQFVAHQT